jgi:cell division control protein 24
MILLCCKEINVNKPKNKMSTRSLVTKDGKPKLQLKGRIFMQNVTETISLQKPGMSSVATRPAHLIISPGSYTCQIFWKGDPGIENFIIRFTSEETMKKWATQVDTQRRVWKDHARTSAGTTASSKPSDIQFAYMRDQVLENPYAEDDDDDDEDPAITNYARDSYNTTNVSPRSRPSGGDTGGPLDAMPPPRFPMGFPSQPSLTLRTQQLQSAANIESHFSPVAETPMSTYSNSRTSSASAGTFPFPRQTPPNGYAHEENNRHTAPVPSRGHMSRDSTSSNYPPRSQRPSLPANANMSSQAQGRLRAASSPDIHNGNPPRKGSTGPQPPVPDLPPFPTHYAYNAAIVNRSQNNSPSNLPPRSGTQSPAIQRDRLIQQRTAAELANPDYHGGVRGREPSFTPLSRTMTPASSFERSQGTLTPASMDSRNMSPPLHDHPNIPSQLKVKVHCPSAGSSMVLVVSTNISFQSLKDRIDAKLQRSTSVSLGSGQVKLKYLDSDSTYVSIQCDDDVLEAFENWQEQQRDLNPGGGQLGEIELFCQR